MKMEERLQKLECRSKEADMALKQLHICLEVLNQRSRELYLYMFKRMTRIFNRKGHFITTSNE